MKFVHPVSTGGSVKFVASSVNFSIFAKFLCFFLLRLLKLGEIGGVKFLAHETSPIFQWSLNQEGRCFRTQKPSKTSSCPCFLTKGTKWCLGIGCYVRIRTAAYNESGKLSSLLCWTLVVSRFKWKLMGLSFSVSISISLICILKSKISSQTFWVNNMIREG